jgi:2-furoyl-CoA dehydrogenase FAD binding subunit
MKPRPFDYVAPASVDEALEVLAKNPGEARVLAGGMSLMAMMNLRLVRPSILVDITRIPGLGQIRVSGGKVSIGATVTQNQLLAWDGLAEHLPFIGKALPWTGHFQTRNRGTVCGSLCHSDPSSELPLSLALLGGEVVLRSRRKERVLPAAEFQLGLLTVAKEDDEMVTEVRFPSGIGRRGSAFEEVARRHGDFAIVGVGAVVLDDGRIRMAAGGLSDTPKVQEFAADIADEDFAARIDRWAWELRGSDDIHATARYRRDILRRLAPKILQEVRACVS